MSALAFVVHVAAVVLAVTGMAKLVDPRAVVSSLAAAGLPSSFVVGRMLGAGELAVGLGALTLGGSATAAALAGWYGAFVVYLVANRVRGLDVPCGCIGGSDRPAGPAHLVVDVIATAAAATAVWRPVGDVSVWLDEGLAGAVALAGIALGAAAVVVVVLPGRMGGSRAGH